MSTLRIIGGKYKQRALASPQGWTVRPTSGRVKESLFNILQFRLPGARVLELFAGTGQIGIEALSRGAEKAVFVEQDITYLQENLRRCGCAEQAEVRRGDFRTVLAGMEESFDIIFADPPYAAGYYEDIMRLCAKLLKKDGLLILEHNSDRPVLPQAGLKLSDIRKYGTRALTFLTEDTHETHDLSGQL